MNTVVLRKGDLNFEEALKRVAKAMLAGEIVAFPTETVYGLGAVYSDVSAVEKIYQVKGRPSDNPLIVHVAHLAQVPVLVEAIPKTAYDLWRSFAPGPLTLILKRSPRVPDLVTAGLDTVAVRFPEHPMALELLRAVKEPLVAPSANRSGRPSPTRAWHVLEDFSGMIPYILDGGPTVHGVESTVLDLTVEVPTILRPGAITKTMLEAVLKRPVMEHLGVDTKQAAGPKAPGMKYRHYAPGIPVHMFDLKESLNLKRLVEKPSPRVYFIPEHALQQIKAVEKQLFLLPKERGEKLLPHKSYYRLYPNAAKGLAELFDFFRLAEDLGAQSLMVATMERQGLGTAFMNRLEKAASGEMMPR